MKFWAFNGAIYVLLLAAGLGLPAAVIWRRAPVGWLDLLAYGGAFLFMVLAAFVLCLLLARVFFPTYWWMGQVEGKDVFEYDGIYFIGLRLTRVPSRLQRLVFGMDERMRRWDLAFGFAVVALLVPHILGVVAASRVYDRVLPNPPKLSQTLNETVLSSLPVMREFGTRWSPDPVLMKRVDHELSLVRMQPRKTNLQRFQLAQYYLIKAFHPRTRASDPFYTSPGERLYFDRSQGAQAVEYLNQLLNEPELTRAGWSGGALALIGFFHLNSHEYGQAAQVLQRALAEMGQRDETGVSRYQVQLLAAQADILAGKEQQATGILQSIIEDDRLPGQAYALALEHYADALRLMGETGKVREILAKSLELYKREGDQGGIARVHLRLAALALGEGKLAEASRELSIASSLASGVQDGFTLNMVMALTQAFPA